MGARPTSLVVSLTMPPATPVAWVEDFADGLTAGLRGLGAADCAVAGGDLGRGRELAVSVAILGTLDGREPVLRSGARPGTPWPWPAPSAAPPPGWPCSNRPTDVRVLTSGQRALMDTQCRPAPAACRRPAGPEAGATAMMDISDGLVRDGDRLAAASHVVLNLDPARPEGARRRRCCRRRTLLGTDPMAWVLGGGEDHGLLATFPAGLQLPPGFTAIGSVQAPAAQGQHRASR